MLSISWNNPAPFVINFYGCDDLHVSNCGLLSRGFSLIGVRLCALDAGVTYWRSWCAGWRAALGFVGIQGPPEHSPGCRGAATAPRRWATGLGLVSWCDFEVWGSEVIPFSPLFLSFDVQTVAAAVSLGEESLLWSVDRTMSGSGLLSGRPASILLSPPPSMSALFVLLVHSMQDFLSV